MLVTVLVAVAVLRAQPSPQHVNWASYGGDPGHRRYSPLAQITGTNVSGLEVAWRFSTTNFGPKPEFEFESTPLAVDGVLYTTAGSRRAVVALDAATGEILWMYRLDEGARGDAAPRQLSGRGLSYWRAGRDARIIYVTPGYQMVALHADTGRPVPTFGRQGIVDLKREADQEVDPVTGELGLQATPAIANDVVIIGAAHLSGSDPKSRRNQKGYVRGYDVRTGRRLWIFHTIPLRGEFGFDPWERESSTYTGNTGVWAQISIDPELGLAYLPVETPTGDYYGGHRPGNNLFGESLVAVDVRTGARKWHFQLIHHGIWDWDVPCAPILVDITRDGRTIKAVAQPTKQSFLCVFDRETGEPIWPIVERSVPQGDVPGEWYAPTQPTPLNGRGQPFAYDVQGVSVDDLIDCTPELRAEAEKVVSRYRVGPLFTPPVVSRADGPLATLIRPTNTGGTNWPGGSYDPETHTLYVASSSQMSAIGLVPPKPGQSDMHYIRGQAPVPAGQSPRFDVQGLPISKPPYLRHHRGHRPGPRRGAMEDRPRRDVRCRAQPPRPETSHVAPHGPARLRWHARHQDAAHRGRDQLWAHAAGASRRDAARLRQSERCRGGRSLHVGTQEGSPMTYMVDGRQYLVVAVSGARYPGELVAYRAPAATP
jgi:quinoprotein glucose dehydrogenase